MTASDPSTGTAGQGSAGGSRTRTILRATRWTIGMAVIAGILFAGGFALFASHVGSLAQPAELAPADAIIVLTGGQSRIDAAVELLRSGKGNRLLISGVNPMAGRDDLRKMTGGEARLFNCCVDIDHEALDTVGNAAESAKWVRRNGYSDIILVTNNYHMPRSLLELRRLLGDAHLIPYPVVNSSLEDGAWMTKPDAVRVMFTEYTKYLAAVARGIMSPTGGPGDVALAAPGAR